jgi:hypothetical protein
MFLSDPFIHQRGDTNLCIDHPLVQIENEYWTVNALQIPCHKVVTLLLNVWDAIALATC